MAGTEGFGLRAKNVRVVAYAVPNGEIQGFRLLYLVVRYAFQLGGNPGLQFGLVVIEILCGLEVAFHCCCLSSWVTGLRSSLISLLHAITISITLSAQMDHSLAFDDSLLSWLIGLA